MPAHSLHRNTLSVLKDATYTCENGAKDNFYIREHHVDQKSNFSTQKQGKNLNLKFSYTIFISQQP